MLKTLIPPTILWGVLCAGWSKWQDILCFQDVIVTMACSGSNHGPVVLNCISIQRHNTLGDAGIQSNKHVWSHTTFNPRCCNTEFMHMEWLLILLIFWDCLVWKFWKLLQLPLNLENVLYYLLLFFHF